MGRRRGRSLSRGRCGSGGHAAESHGKLLLEEFDVGDACAGEPQVLGDLPSDDHATHAWTYFCLVCTDPGGVPQQLADNAVVATRHLELGVDEAPLCIDSKDVSETSADGGLDAGDALVLVQPQAWLDVFRWRARKSGRSLSPANMLGFTKLSSSGKSAVSAGSWLLRGGGSAAGTSSSQPVGMQRGLPAIHRSRIVVLTADPSVIS